MILERGFETGAARFKWDQEIKKEQGRPSDAARDRGNRLAGRKSG